MRLDDWSDRDDVMGPAMRRAADLPDAPRPDDTSYAPYVSKEELEDDLGLAWGLFDHVARNDHGVIYPGRLQAGGRLGPSPDERDARDAAARLLLAGSHYRCGEARPRFGNFIADWLT
jgi:hypothetical protein